MIITILFFHLSKLLLVPFAFSLVIWGIRVSTWAFLSLSRLESISYFLITSSKTQLLLKQKKFCGIKEFSSPCYFLQNFFLFNAECKCKIGFHFLKIFQTYNTLHIYTNISISPSIVVCNKLRVSACRVIEFLIKWYHTCIQVSTFF